MSMAMLHGHAPECLIVFQADPYRSGLLGKLHFDQLDAPQLISGALTSPGGAAAKVPRAVKNMSQW